MAGKASVFAGRRLHYAIDKLSKNALIDLVVDLAKLDIGEEGATEEALAAKITEWMGPISRARGDRPLDLNAQIVYRDARDEEYRTKTGRFRQVD